MPLIPIYRSRGPQNPSGTHRLSHAVVTAAPLGQATACKFRISQRLRPAPVWSVAHQSRASAGAR